MITKYARTINEIAEANVPPLREFAIFVSLLPSLEAKTFIINIPIIEQNKPRDASASGSDMSISLDPS